MAKTEVDWGDDCWSWVMGPWEAGTLLSLPLRTLAIVHKNRRRHFLDAGHKLTATRRTDSASLSLEGGTQAPTSP